MTSGLLEGVNLYCYGDSWYGADVMNSGPDTRSINRVARRLGPKNVINSALSGHSTGDNLHNAVVPGTRTWIPGSRGLVVMPASINDLFHNAAMTDAQFIEAVTLDLFGMIHLLSATAWVDNSSSAFTYGPGWSHLSPAQASNNSVRYATANNAYVDYVPGTTAVSIGTASLLESAYENMMITVTQGGTVRGQLDLRDKNFGGQVADAGKQKVWRVSGLTPGVTMRITYTTQGRTGAFGYFDGILRPAAAPPSILLVKPLHLPTPLYPAYDDPQRITVLRDAVDVITSSFAHVYSCDPLPGWDYAAMIGSDTVHPNDRGMAHLADVICEAIEGLPWRVGMHR